MANKVSSRKIKFSHVRKLSFVTMTRKVCHGEERFVTANKSLPGQINKVCRGEQCFVTLKKRFHGKEGFVMVNMIFFSSNQNM